MFKFPCKINISKLGMFWLGFILCSNVMHRAEGGENSFAYR